MQVSLGLAGSFVMLVTSILTIIEGHFQAFQRFSRSKVELQTVESCFVALNDYENGSTFDAGSQQPEPQKNFFNGP
jgi:hypothetical protein